jgi:hypothetical protein
MSAINTVVLPNRLHVITDGVNYTPSGEVKGLPARLR